MKINKFNIPDKIFWCLAICAAVVLFFLIAGIIPISGYKKGLNNEIIKLKVQAEEQKNLLSIYAILIKNQEKKDQRTLPNPAKTALSRQEASKFQDIFKELAEKCGMKTISITPDLNTLIVSSQYLFHTAIVKGDFFNFRKMLMSLGELSYLEKIEEIHIQQYPDSFEFKMRIAINLGN